MTIIKADYENKNCSVGALAKDFDERLKRQERLRIELAKMQDQYDFVKSENKSIEEILAKIIDKNCVFLGDGRVMFATSSGFTGYTQIYIKQGVR